jgi:hypothetical protein
MKGQRAENATNPKKAWNAPRLIMYGDLRRLTHGGGNEETDGIGGGQTREDD